MLPPPGPSRRSPSSPPPSRGSSTPASPGATTRRSFWRASRRGPPGSIPTSSRCPPEPHHLAAGVAEADRLVGPDGRHVARVDLEHDLADVQLLERVAAEERGRLAALARPAVIRLAD